MKAIIGRSDPTVNHGIIRRAAIAVVWDLLSEEGVGEYVNGAGAYITEWQVRKLFLGDTVVVDVVGKVVVSCLGGVLRFRRLRLDSKVEGSYLSGFCCLSKVLFEFAMSKCEAIRGS